MAKFCQKFNQILAYFKIGSGQVQTTKKLKPISMERTYDLGLENQNFPSTPSLLSEGDSPDSALVRHLTVLSCNTATYFHVYKPLEKSLKCQKNLNNKF